MAASCIVAFLASVVAGRGRLHMVHIRNATVAGGVAVGAVADMAIQPTGALIIGTLAGLIAALGAHYVTPRLNRRFVHDTCERSASSSFSLLLSCVVYILENKYRRYPQSVRHAGHTGRVG